MNYTELCDTAAPAYSFCNSEYLSFPKHASLLITDIPSDQVFCLLHPKEEGKIPEGKTQ